MTSSSDGVVGSQRQVYDDDVTWSTIYRSYRRSTTIATTTSASVLSVSVGGGAWSMPLWLPYVCLTVVILALLAASFVHFHVQHGFQYSERSQQASTDCVPTSTPASSSRQHFVEPRHPTGSRALLASNIVNGSTSVSSTPELKSRPGNSTMIMFDDHCRRSPHQRQPLTGSGGCTVIGDRSSDVGELNDFRSVAEAVIDEAKRINWQRSRSSEVVRSRHSVRGGHEFAFNMNGSMVDVRCVDDERTKTFRLAAGGSRDTMSSLVVMTTSFEDSYADDDRVPLDDVIKTHRSVVARGDRSSYDRPQRPTPTYDGFRLENDVIGNRYPLNGHSRILGGRPASTGVLLGESRLMVDRQASTGSSKSRLHHHGSRPSDYR